MTLTPGFEAFCRDLGVQARACAPYRAQTKGKTESGVGYVKGNALAGRRFSSLEELQAHLLDWSLKADERIHGTTGKKPREEFEKERALLRALPKRNVVVPSRRLLRRVASDALVDVDTARYSVPYRLVKEDLEVLVLEEEVVIFRGAEEVARHRRAKEPRERVIDPRHYDGLWRPWEKASSEMALEDVFPGRTLAAYQAVVEGAVP